MKSLKNITALFLVLIICASSLTVFAGEQPLATLTVAGNATIKTVPDIAYVTFSIKTFEYDAKASQEENKVKSNSIYAELDILEVDKKDIKTQSYTIKPIYENIRVEEKKAVEIDGVTEYVTEYKNEAIFKGYETVNTIVVTVNDVDKDVALVGKIIDLSISNGANQANGVSFVLSDEKRDTVYLEALHEATERVNKKAQTVATGLGVTGLRPLTINIENINVNMTKPPVYPAYSSGGGGSAEYRDAAVEEFYTPISPGETSVSANVAVIFTY